MKLSRAVQGFLLFKSGEGLSRKTIETYKIRLEQLVVWAGDPELDAITVHDLINFLGYLRHDYRPVRWNGDTKPLSSQSIRNTWITLRSFYTWAVAILGVDDALSGVPQPKSSSVERVPFTQAEVKALLGVTRPIKGKRSQSGQHYRQQLRDQAIILVLLDTGIRASELCGLAVGDLDLSNGRLSVRGKGNKHRYVYLADVARRAVWHYLAEQFDADPGRCLFIGATGRPLSRQWLRRHLAHLGEKAGVPNTYPHRFRYTFAIEYLRNGGDIFTLQMLLGHSSLEMVRRYAKLADVDSARVHASASPADRWLK